MTTYHDLFKSTLNWDVLQTQKGRNTSILDSKQEKYALKPEYIANTKIRKSTPLQTKRVENFSSDVPVGMNMTTENIINNNLTKYRKDMLSDSKADYSTSVSNPYGYGYVSSLQEVRNQDAKDIQMQQGTMFALGAITGVSVIVVGLLFLSSTDAVPTSSSN